MTETEYIILIKELSPKYDKTSPSLIALLDYYNALGLRDLTLEQLKAYYELKTNKT